MGSHTRLNVTPLPENSAEELSLSPAHLLPGWRSSTPPTSSRKSSPGQVKMKVSRPKILIWEKRKFQAPHWPRQSTITCLKNTLHHNHHWQQRMTFFLLYYNKSSKQGHISLGSKIARGWLYTTLDLSSQSSASDLLASATPNTRKL